MFSLAQPKLEAQIGGADFAGITINSAYDINLGKSGNHRLIPIFGIGMAWAWWLENMVITHIGLIYQYRQFGIGLESSSFGANPFWGEFYPHSFVDLILYPNINYTIQGKGNWYFAFSAGAYFAYSVETGNSWNGHQGAEFEGDVIPALGFTAGYKFDRLARSSE